MLLEELKKKLKKLLNMKMTVLSNLIGTPGTIPKELVKGLKDLKIRRRVETIQITTLLKSVRILRIVLEIRGNLLTLRLLKEAIS